MSTIDQDVLCNVDLVLHLQAWARDMHNKTCGF